ncbi:MAG: beta-lactamase family protein [Acidobacteria bacterium]|nr:beta-lactamase family protein [Acidobacteriota bacterium]
MTLGSLAILVAGTAALSTMGAEARTERAAVPPGGAPTPPRFEDPDRRARLEAAFPEIDRIFRAWADTAKAPGVTWGIVIDGQLAHTGAVGIRDLATEDAVTVDSVFRIASMTKSFTAMAVLKLRDEGRLALDDPVERYIPELARIPYPTRDAPRITIRHLLTHSAGFPEDNPWGDRHLDASPDELAAWLREGIPFSRAPGVAFEYSNYGFALLGRVVAAASDQPYRDYVDEAVLRPLGMSASTWEATSVPPDHLARGYRREDDEWIEEIPLAHGTFGAMGGLYSSVPDLARYTSFLLSAWPPRDDPETGPIRRASAREMQQAQRLSVAAASRPSVEAPLRLVAGGYGFGLGERRDCRFERRVSHSGGLPGYGSNMTWLPEHGVALVCLANVTYAGCGRAVSDALEALAETGALKPRVPQPAPALEQAREDVSRLVADWDDSLADRILADNVFLDRPREVRRKEIEELHARHGECRDTGSIEARNPLRGGWRMACDRGHLRVDVTLAPTSPPRVQSLSVRGALPLGEPLSTLAAHLAALTKEATAQDLGLPLGPGLDTATLRARVQAAASRWGGCRLDEVLEGDGTTHARLRLVCAQGDLEAALRLDGDGRLTEVSLEPDPRATCVP